MWVYAKARPEQDGALREAGVAGRGGEGCAGEWSRGSVGWEGSSEHWETGSVDGCGSGRLWRNVWRVVGVLMPQIDPEYAEANMDR